jgi:hypothetical protein
MNIQEQIAEQHSKLATLRALLSKELSLWTTDEASQYGNKATASVEKDLVEVNIQLLNVEYYLDKPSKDWTDDETDKYGGKEQLRKKEEQLRKKEEQLRKKEELLLQLKLKEPPSTQGISLLTLESSGPLTILTEMFNNRFKFDGKSTSAAKRKKFKPLLVRDYLKIEQQDFHSGAQISCQILDILLPSFLVIGAHIFKHEWAKDAPILLGIKNIDSTRNGLLLFHPIEKAFDCSQLCFVKNEGEGAFQLKILDPSLRDQELLTSCLKFISEKDCQNLNLSLSEMHDIVSEALFRNGRQLTFGDLEGNELICKGKTTPYKRCLNFHASRARDYAIQKKWISPDIIFKYSWSEDFGETVLLDYLNSLETSFDDPNVGQDISDENLAIYDNGSDFISISDVS